MEKTFFDQTIKNNKITYENIKKIATGQGDGYATDCLLDHNYFRDNFKMIAKDLSKQQAFDADPRAIKQKYKNLFYFQRSKRNCLRLFKRNCKSIVNML